MNIFVSLEDIKSEKHMINVNHIMSLSRVTESNNPQAFEMWGEHTIINLTHGHYQLSNQTPEEIQRTLTHAEADAIRLFRDLTEV